jgi:predicted phage terminase large subunit-like protein
MTFEKLLELEKEALQLNNYQYKNVLDDEKIKLALKSFYRIPDPDQQLVYQSWKKYCDKEKINFDIKDAIRLRFLAQTNLFFLCKMLEKYKDITIKAHEEICNDFFVSKDPANFKTFKDFALDYKYIKERLLLVPRGGFKSSIDMADTVQWIICFPEVTILILTGVLQLARDFVGEIRGHFLLEDTGEVVDKKPVYGPKTMGDGTKSLFQILFPEHCVRDVGKETEFQTPACKIPDKEPTVMSASIEQNLSGWHFCIMKLDDVVTNENTITIGRMEGTNRQISINQAMLHPFGFFDVIGTWYDEADYYGITIKKEEQESEELGLKHKASGSVWDGFFNSELNIKIYLRAAWWPTEEAKKLGKIEEEMKESDWILWCPEILSYAFLMKKKKSDPEGFAIKYENNPRKVHQIKFPRELLIRRTIPAHMLPPTGMVVSTWDTAYSTKNFADYTVGITSLIYGGRFYIIDMVRGRFNEFELPVMIAQNGFKWKPRRIAIEDSMGVKWIGREIRREMDKLGISIPIEYVSLGFGTKSKSKELKAKPVSRLLGDERLLLSNSCNAIEELYNELEKFPKGTHDDIVSALSILVDQFAAYADMDARLNFVETDFNADRQSMEKHNMIYGLGKYSKFNVNFALTEQNIQDLPSYVPSGNLVLQMERDPLQELFI